MSKMSLLSNLLGVSMLFALLTACQTIPNSPNKEEPTLLKEQQMRDSTLHGPKEHIVPILSKTYNMEQDTTNTEE